MLRKRVMLCLLALATSMQARSALAQNEEFMKRVYKETEMARVLTNGTMKDFWDAPLSVQGLAIIALRGRAKAHLSPEQLSDWTSASVELSQCLREKTFPHVDPETFRPETTIKAGFDACMKQLKIEPSNDPDYPNGPNWKHSESTVAQYGEFMKRVNQDSEMAKVLISGTMKDFWDATLKVQGLAIIGLRGSLKIVLSPEQLHDWTSASAELGQCLREKTFPHVDPETFRPDTTLKAGFDACMKQLKIEPSNDPDCPNGPNWKRSDSAEKIRQLLQPTWDKLKQKQ